VIDPRPGDLSLVPYGEPTWLTPAYRSPYYKESHGRLQQRAVRMWVDEVLKPEASEKGLAKRGVHQWPSGRCDGEEQFTCSALGAGLH
jgi:hypothetical protein